MVEKIGHRGYGLHGPFLPFMKQNVGTVVPHEGSGKTVCRCRSILTQSVSSFASIASTLLKNLIVMGYVIGLQR